MDFWLHYFDFTPGLISGLISLFPLYFKRAVFHQESKLDLAFSCGFTTLWMIVTLIFVHLIITKVGMIYINAEVLREGNDQTLDNLEEGVIILYETDLEIKFQNKAARIVTDKQHKEDSSNFDMSLEKQTYTAMV